MMLVQVVFISQVLKFEEVRSVLFFIFCYCFFLSLLFFSLPTHLDCWHSYVVPVTCHIQDDGITWYNVVSLCHYGFVTTELVYLCRRKNRHVQWVCSMSTGRKKVQCEEHAHRLKLFVLVHRK